MMWLNILFLTATTPTHPTPTPTPIPRSNSTITRSIFNKKYYIQEYLLCLNHLIWFHKDLLYHNYSIIAQILGR